MRLLAIFTALYWLVLPARAEDLPTCAVLTFEAGKGTSAIRAKLFSDRFATALERTERYNMMPRNTCIQQLDAKGFDYTAGCAEAACAVEAGRLLGCDKVIAGMVERRSGQFAAYAFLVDVESGAIEQSRTTYSSLPLDSALRELADQAPLALTLASRDWIVELDHDRDMHLVWIPAGIFHMGSTKAERHWAAGDEGLGKPEWFVHEGKQPVLHAIDQWFWMGRTEVSVGQWAEFIKDTSYVTDAEKNDQVWGWNWEISDWDWLSGHGWWNPGFDTAPSDDDPVTSVSWRDAMAFCRWLTKREQEGGRLPDGYQYRLPTEAEWEYACRGGNSGTRFWWGDDLEDGAQRMNGAGLDGDELGLTWQKTFPWHDGYVFVSPVDTYGRLGRNGFDLADMLGNVWEWCLDSFHETSAQPELYTGDPDRRVVRGGAFNRVPGMTRCAFRTWNCPSLAYSYFGFRVCLGPMLDAKPVRKDGPIRVRSR